MPRVFKAALVLMLAAAGVFAVFDRNGGISVNAGELPTESGFDPLVLVNDKNEYKKTPSSLVSLLDSKSNSYFVKDKTVELCEEAVAPLNEMMDGFFEYSGEKTVNVISGYRSAGKQAEIYNAKLKKYGRKYTEKHVQKPFNSEHQTGLAVDLALYYPENGSSADFDGNGKYAWFRENSWKYGFVLRYSEEKSKKTGIACEPWHFRFVGRDNAEYMHRHGLCLEEYVKILGKQAKL